MMVTKHDLAEIGCRLYLKSRWGWVRVCWVRSEAFGPASPPASALLNTGTHSYMDDGESFRRASLGADWSMLESGLGAQGGRFLLLDRNFAKAPAMRLGSI